MRIRWFGHSCFAIRDNISIVTDPHDGKSLGIPKPVIRSDLVLISHDHFDHNCARIVQGLTTTIINTPGKAKTDVDIVGIKTFHDNEKGARRGENIVYRFKLDDVTICHLGDLGEIPSQKIIDEIGPVDILMAPVGNVFTIGAKQAKDIAKKLDAKVVIPMHYRVRGLSLSIKGVDGFLSLYPEDRVNHIGNEIDFLPEDLPKEQEVWVFTL